MTSLTVSMPAYNEAENIRAMIDLVREKAGPLVDELEIVVVNDGSKDDTAAIVEAISRQDPRVRLINHAVNLGYGAAVRDAVWAAGKELILLTDSDLQFDLAELGRFLQRIDGADMVIGYRYARSDPWHRRLFGHGWSWLVNLLFGYTARDVDCAFKLFKRRVIETIHVESGGAMFSAEFLVRAKRAGFKIVEEPVSHHPRRAGSQTGARPDVILRAFRELLKMRWRMWMGK
ncbi:MAG: glycosyltransferase family 2 protein [Chloroflexi bacterium]|nr:glycosyltransferase family 2 protein [Chloroflexota bacterium]